MPNKILEAGDIVYHSNYGAVRSKNKIDRVTPKMAFIGHKKFNRETDERGYLKEIGGYYDGPYQIETPELIEKWERKCIADRLSKINWQHSSWPPIDALRAIKDILNNHLVEKIEVR